MRKNGKVGGYINFFKDYFLYLKNLVHVAMPIS